MNDDVRHGFESRENTAEIRNRLERAQQIADDAPLKGGQQRKLLDYIIAECDTQISQARAQMMGSRALSDFREFLDNLSDFIGEA